MTFTIAVPMWLITLAGGAVGVFLFLCLVAWSAGLAMSILGGGRK